MERLRASGGERRCFALSAGALSALMLARTSAGDSHDTATIERLLLAERRRIERRQRSSPS